MSDGDLQCSSKYSFHGSRRRRFRTSVRAVSLDIFGGDSSASQSRTGSCDIESTKCSSKLPLFELEGLGLSCPDTMVESWQFQPCSRPCCSSKILAASKVYFVSGYAANDMGIPLSGAASLVALLPFGTTSFVNRYLIPRPLHCIPLATHLEHPG